MAWVIFGPDAMLGPIFGTGLKFFNVPGHSILENEAGVSNFDYAMINAPVFFANTAKDYVVIERLFDALPGALIDLGPRRLGFTISLHSKEPWPLRSGFGMSSLQSRR